MSVAAKARGEVMKTIWKEKEAKAETWRIPIFNAQAEEKASKKNGK